MNNIVNNYVGVDVAKHELEVYIHPIAKRMTVKNNEIGIKKLISFLNDFEIENVVFEASGGYEFLMMRKLQKAKYRVWQVDPRRIKAFIISEGKRAKTDQIDAKMIALFATEKKCEYPKQLYDDSIIELQALVKRRDELVLMISAEKNREQNIHDSYCKKHIRKMIKFLEKELKKIEQKIKEVISKNNDLLKKADIIESVPGIGTVTAAVLVGCLPELGNATDKEIAALVGVAPYVRQSGQYKGRSKIVGGRGMVRKTLYMVALCAIQYNPRLKSFYDRLKSKNKKTKVALIAVIHKIIVIVNALVQKGERWRGHSA